MKAPEDTFHLITHDDLDGAACSVVARGIMDCKRLVIRYCNYANIDRITSEVIYKSKPRDVIIIADICPGKKQLDWLNKLDQTVILVDHHETRKELLEHYEWTTYCEPDCGALGLYKYLVDRGTKLTFISGLGAIPRDENSISAFLEAVNAYDNWLLDHPARARGERLTRLCSFLGPEAFSEMAFRLSGDVEERVLGMLELDKTLINNQLSYIEKAMKNMKKMVDEDSRLMGLVYAERNISALGKAILETHPSLTYVLIVNPLENTMSLRSREINVADIAKRWGGGGHAQAAGIPGIIEVLLSTLKRPL